MKSVKDYSISENTTIKKLVEKFGEAGGFSAKKVFQANKLYQKMQSDKDCFKILSHPACIVSTGLRGVIRDLIKNKKGKVEQQRRRESAERRGERTLKTKTRCWFNIPSQGALLNLGPNVYILVFTIT